MSDSDTQTSNGNHLPDRLSDVRKVWISSEIVPSDLSIWGVPGFTKEKIGFMLDECSQLAFKLRGIDWQAPVSLALRQAEIYLQPISNFVATRITQPNPETEINNFLSNLLFLLLILRNASTFSSDRAYNAEQELLKLMGQIESARPVLENLNEINKELTELKSQAEASATNIANSEKSVLESQGRITTISSSVLPHLILDRHSLDF